uniref:Small-subunit processome Utp12 domain-containing protein n=1 Tax=Xenopus tropicalis TaxID=8364 RepID=A0A1B8XXB2_XENTR
MSTWVFGAERWQNLIYYSLGGHKDAIVACFFQEGSLDLYTISADATLCVWGCDTELAQLLPRDPDKKARESGGAEEPRAEEIRGTANPAPEESVGRVRYRKSSRHFFNKEGDFTALTAAAFHKKLNILVTGFSSGMFHIHELPELSLIHSLRYWGVPYGTGGGLYPHSIAVLCSSLPELYVQRLLVFLATQIERSRHLQFYLMWAHQLLLLHGHSMKSRSVSVLPAVHSLQKSLQGHLSEISKLCEWNRYNMKFALCLSRQRGMKRGAEESEAESVSGSLEGAEQ